MIFWGPYLSNKLKEEHLDSEDDDESEIYDVNLGCKASLLGHSERTAHDPPGG